MPKLTFQVTVPASLNEVWRFHNDVQGSLPALSPPENEVRIESADLPLREGSRILINVKDPLGRRLRWVARIVEHRPPDAVASGDAAGFVDEQESGPFAFWRHEHDFGRAGEHATLVTDTITYRAPFGPIGWLADRLFLRRQISAMFHYRHEATLRLLGGADTLTPASHPGAVIPLQPPA